MSASVIVVDLDGTLCNVDHRRPLVTGKHRDYDAFHAKLSDDPVNEWCKRLILAMHGTGYDVALVSARPKKYEFATRQWLTKNEVPFTMLYLLREDGSDTPDQEIKTAWARDFGLENILFWVDDRKKVVDAIRSLGVTVLQCVEGAY